MRLISQDGMIDVSYEQASIEVNGNDIYCGYSSIITRHCTGRRFAEYSSKDKAIKVMEMVRKAYLGIPVVLQNVEVPNDAEKFFGDKNIIYACIPEQKPKVEYLNNVIFQFPSDDEVEV